MSSEFEQGMRSDANWLDEKVCERVKGEVDKWPDWKKDAYEELVSDFRVSVYPGGRPSSR